MKKSKIRRIRMVIFDERDDLIFESDYMHPNYRLPYNKKSPFKQMEKSPTKWATNLIKAVS